MRSAYAACLHRACVECRFKSARACVDLGAVRDWDKRAVRLPMIDGRESVVTDELRRKIGHKHRGSLVVYPDWWYILYLKSALELSVVEIAVLQPRRPE